MKTLIVDVRPIVSKLHQNWDGNGTFTKYLNKKSTKDLIFTTIHAITENKLKDGNFTFNVKDREVKIILDWNESINIEQWNTITNETLKTAVHNLINKDLISYVA